MSENYILLMKKQGRKKERSFMSLKSGSSKVELLPGTLLFLTETFTKEGRYIFLLETFDQDTVDVQCIPGEIEKIGPGALDLLLPVATCQDRLAVYQDKEWLKEGLSLQVDDYVYVKAKGEQREMPAVIRWKGNGQSMKGILFGVELTDDRGAGTSDGTFRKVRYFQCPQDSALFCPVHRIRKRSPGARPRRRQDDSYTTVHIASQDFPNCRLHLGDRVVWMSDRGPECGAVKWIGILPDDRTGEITVGVEFDSPVGSGTGKYKEHRLFYARQNHASLVPILGLLKEEEFFNPGATSQGTYCDELTVQLEAVPNNHSRTQMYDDFNRKSPDYDHSDISLSRKDNSDILRQGMKTREMPQYSTDIGLGSSVDKLRLNNLSDPSEKPYSDSGLNLEVKSDGASNMNPLYAYKEKLSDSVNDDFVSKISSTKDTPTPDPDLSVDSMVEVLGKPPLYGVIRWIGALVDNPWKQIAGLEMEEEISAGTDGTFKGKRLFQCASKRALFVPLYKCKKDKRFNAPHRKSTESASFGLLETPDIVGSVSPPSSLNGLQMILGKNRGIQGHHNSCYLDATLFAMFAFTTVFDSILYRPKNEEDLEAYEDVQRVLKEGIVNPLRKLSYVRADKVMNLRVLLDKLGQIPGMMGEEKDPEEFLSSLLGQIMKADPLLQLSSGENTNFYQLFMEKNDLLLMPTTQKLVELSFLQSDVKLKEVPSCLIIQMPRFGKDYKMFRRIIPSLELDITDILEEGLRECIICGKMATYECKNCYQLHGPMLNATAYCEDCCKTCHQHKNRRGHSPSSLKLNMELVGHVSQRPEVDLSAYREKMELFAVVCIQTSHYVSFVKCGSGREAPWVFFDSMADRMGEQKGYNIPEVKEVPELSEWLSENHWDKIHKIEDDKQLPEDIRRLLCDAYMCLYQNTEVAMFK